jgi:hypothetical protein
MAKVFVVLMTLFMLGVWGWMAWGEYAGYIESVPPIKTTLADANPLEKVDVTLRPRTSIVGALLFYAGMRDSSLDEYQPLAEPQAVADLRIALGAIVAFAATMIFAVTGGSGAIFSVMVTGFVAFFAAAANMVFALSLLVRTGWAMFGAADPVDYRLAVYGVALYGLLAVVTAFTMMRQMPSLVRGKRSAMHAVMKCLLILMIASLGLAPLGLPAEFVFLGYHGLYALAALCLLSLLFIGLTHGNYQYD